MKQTLVALSLILSLACVSCQKERLYTYTYHWKESKFADWNEYNIIVEDYLSEGAIEVHRQTEDNKVIVRGLTNTGVVWESYITYCCSQER